MGEMAAEWNNKIHKNTVLIPIIIIPADVLNSFTI